MTTSPRPTSDARESEHTPAPWNVDPTSGLDIIFDGQQIVAQTIGTKFSENAAFIVRAVNAHDDLMKALTEARAWITVDRVPLTTSELVQLIDAALAKAGAQS